MSIKPCYRFKMKRLEEKKMNERIKNVLEGTENRRMELDDILPFFCTCCGGCCVHQEELLLNPLDLFRLAKELGITTERWIKQYGECYIGEDSRVPETGIRADRGVCDRLPLFEGQGFFLPVAADGGCGRRRGR